MKTLYLKIKNLMPELTNCLNKKKFIKQIFVNAILVKKCTYSYYLKLLKTNDNNTPFTNFP